MTPARARLAGAIALVLGALAILPSSCRPRHEISQRRDLVRVGSAPFLSYLPLMIANDEGYFRDENIDVEFVRATRAGAAAILQSGGIDVYAGQIAPSALNAVARGAHIRIVAEKGSLSPEGCTVYALVARKELFATPGFGSPESFRGLRSTWTHTSISEYFQDRILAPAGLSSSDLVDTDIDYTAVNVAFEKQKLDIDLLAEPYLTEALDTGSVRTVLDVSSITPNFPLGLLMYGPRLLERQRDLGERFMRAYLRGVRQYRLGKTDRNVAIAVRETHLPEKLIRQSCWTTIRADGSLDLGGIDQFAQWAYSNGYTDRLVPASEIVDDSFASTAAEAVASAISER